MNPNIHPPYHKVSCREPDGTIVKDSDGNDMVFYTTAGKENDILNIESFKRHPAWNKDMQNVANTEDVNIKKFNKLYNSLNLFTPKESE